MSSPLPAMPPPPEYKATPSPSAPPLIEMSRNEPSTSKSHCCTNIALETLEWHAPRSYENSSYSRCDTLCIGGPLGYVLVAAPVGGIFTSASWSSPIPFLTASAVSLSVFLGTQAVKACTHSPSIKARIVDYRKSFKQD